MTTATPEDAARRNLLLLVQLRWLAVLGQLTTILGVHLVFNVRLPLVPMLITVGVLVSLNLAMYPARALRPATNAQVMAGLLVDVSCLTMLLYLSGGATNPFVSLYLLQVVLGAVLLETASSWALVFLTSAAFAFLAVVHRPLPLPPMLSTSLSGAFLFALWFNYTLTATLIVQFVTRIARNLRDRDARLAELRQRAAEEEHIVRMGLLASGAAHELGTPLASISVALGDWRADRKIAKDPQLSAEVADMQAEVARCKAIVAGILFAAGEISGEAPERTTLRRFVTGLVEAWPRNDNVILDYRLGSDLPIVADRALGQSIVNLLDNAVEAGATRIRLSVGQDEDVLVLSVRDDGRGFPEEILPRIGDPYNSSKGRQGAGLGLFLTHNVLRTLGGTLTARNREPGGAEVLLRVPQAALALEDEAE
ncbi:sensor histidine kinase [Sphingomonas sp. ABOLD]|uniref:histidine kinase n=1 Tax=Sphingomonas trueperi TaxID=53317 RepID=A0A7X5XXL3_9SPHN|nr:MULTISPECIES: ATP-binding protein [Sphingomonas]NJB97223.1 two-component system sensor histidine kinase RegB [Sphingomonas trueperi]RSV49394.1 sensor histidine kinase [Sphingomonas sp. ABOLD]